MELINRVNKAIEDFLAPIGGEVRISCDLDFAYFESGFEDEADEITWSFLTTERADRNFSRFFEEELNCHMNLFIYSIFHEYGHKVTRTCFDTKAYNYYHKTVEDLDVIEDADERDNIYFHLPLEMAASKWAADYINNHFQSIVDWWNNVLSPLMNEFLSNSEAVREITDILESDEEAFL